MGTSPWSEVTYACGGAKNFKITSKLKSSQESDFEFHGIVVGLEEPEEIKK